MLKIKDIYKYRTIEKLATVVKIIDKKEQERDVVGKFNLLPIQKWFFDYNKIDPQHFHQSIMLQSSVKLDVNVLRDIFMKIQNYHDALRTSYYIQDGKVVGEIMDEKYPLNYKVINIDDSKLDKVLVNSVLESMQKSVNLEAGPMMNIVIFRTKEIDYLYIFIHHLAVDTVSWGIILNDIETLYNQYLNNESYKLANKTSSIKEWSEEIYQYSNSSEFLQEKEYWKKVQNRKLKDFPYDFNCNSNIVKDSKVIEFSLSEEETTTLIKQANTVLKCDIVDILLSTLATSLYRVSGNKENSIMFEGHGREELFDDINLQRTVGWFTSTFPIILETDESDDIITTLDRTILIRNSVPNNGIGYNILKYITDESKKKDIDWSNIPKISFNYHRDTDSNNTSSLFNVVQNNYGINISEDSERHFELEFNGEISNKKLRIMLTYNGKAFDHESIMNLVYNYKDRLIEVLNLNLDSIRKDAFVENIKYLADKYNTPGLIVGVRYPNNDIVVATNGMANIDQNIVMNSDYKIKIGSITKTFVATIILQLVEENLLDLDRSIKYYLPSVVESYEKLDFSKTTIRSLLNHSSGIRDYTKNQRILTELQDGYYRRWNKEELLELGLEISNTEEMKSNSWIYSSTGYILLGMIIEKITNLSLEQNIENRICRKLNLINTKMIELKDINNEFVHCYSNSEKMDITNWDLTLGWAAGGMISTSKELLIWLEAFIVGKLLNDKEAIYDYIDASMNYPENYDVKVGLGIFNINNLIGHEGNGLGYQNMLFSTGKYELLVHLNQDWNAETTIVSQAHQIVNELIKIIR